MKVLTGQSKNTSGAAYLDMGKALLSTGGKTKIFSPGFSGCFGVIVANGNGKGGLAAHVLEGAGKEGFQSAYYLGTTVKLIKRAQLVWDSLCVVLTHGDPDLYPQLPIQVHGVFGNSKKVSVIDARRKEKDGYSGKDNYANDQFLYDPDAQEISLQGGSFSLDMSDPDETVGITKDNPMPLPFTNDRSMPIYVCG